MKNIITFYVVLFCQLSLAEGFFGGNSGGSGLPTTGGTMSGNIAMGNNKITGLGAATTSGDALKHPGTTHVRLHTGAGHGSTKTKIRRFATVEINSGDMTVTQSAENGDSVTIGSTGVYAITYIDNASATYNFGISVNVDTGDIYSITPAQRKALVTTANSFIGTAHWTGWLTAGNVVRAHDDGAGSRTDEYIQFEIIKLF